MTNKIVFSLRVNLARSDHHDLRVNYLAVSSQRVQKSELRLNQYLQAKQRICRECIVREITTINENNVDNAILELYDSCNLQAL